MVRQTLTPNLDYVLIEGMSLRSTERRQTGLLPRLGLVLLSGLWALSSLSSELLPHASGPTPSAAARQAALFAVFAALAAGVAVAQRLKFPRGRLALACIGVGLGLFVAPSMLGYFAGGAVSTLDRVAVFSLTPVFTVVLQPYLQGEIPRRGKAALPAAMGAVAGILFLLPLDAPGSWRAAAALCALAAAALGIAITNCLAVRLAGALANDSCLPMAALAGGASAVCFAMAGAMEPHAAWWLSTVRLEALTPMAIDLAGLFLLFWLMRQMAASRMAARFLVAPLFTVVAAVILEPTAPTERAWLGMTLLAGGAGWLIFAPDEQAESGELGPLHEALADSSRPVGK